MTCTSTRSQALTIRGSCSVAVLRSATQKRHLLITFVVPIVRQHRAILYTNLFSFATLPYIISFWAFAAATCGPAKGPTLSGFSVAAERWRWSLWEILCLAGPVFVSMFVLLPETYTPTNLLRNAQRLRKLTGNNQFKSQSEIDQADINARSIVFEALVRPFQLILEDPAIAYATCYTTLIYLAGDDFARSSLAFAAVLFGRPMYIGIGIGPRVSLLGGLSVVSMLGLFGLYHFGEKLRARSKFAAK